MNHYQMEPLWQIQSPLLKTEQVDQYHLQQPTLTLRSLKSKFVMESLIGLYFITYITLLYIRSYGVHIYIRHDFFIAGTY